ncbi:hypothetical protein MWU52_05305 [Jannaschia sp. S6380]|uniref:hypothetical protein n=1 Tax=Jannaschia sp. S6380 TaxID=2926408 RepID=UPI001FF658F5|nr:hypothetical protein [Jannaschia sp. S6380]MCK0166963.1 hypothetical protein [Jannaschia sp. S6380]
MLDNHTLTHRKLDLTRQDVRTLHPLLQLLDPEQTDVTMEFAERLIGLLIRNEEAMEQQTKAFQELTLEMSQLRREMEQMKQSIAFLLGDPERDTTG